MLDTAGNVEFGAYGSFQTDKILSKEYRCKKNNSQQNEQSCGRNAIFAKNYHRVAPSGNERPFF